MISDVVADLLDVWLDYAQVNGIRVGFGATVKEHLDQPRVFAGRQPIDIRQPRVKENGESIRNTVGTGRISPISNRCQYATKECGSESPVTRVRPLFQSE